MVKDYDQKLIIIGKNVLEAEFLMVLHPISFES